MTVAEYMKELASKLPGLLEARKSEIVEEIGALVSDNMINAANRSWLLIENARASGKPAPRYVPRTDNDPRLYVNSGALLKAASIPNAKGNVSEIIYKNGKFTVKIGVDLEVVPYARIHELGGQAGRNKSVTIKARPYLIPALKEFNDSGATLRELIDDVMANLERLTR